jgi:hypothetical protein
MASSYPKKLEEWVKGRDTPRSDMNLVRFLAVRDDVSAAVASGFAVKTIWTNMLEAGRIDCSYQTFLRYVKRYVLRPDLQPDKVASGPKAATRVDDRKIVPATELATSKAPGPAPAQGFKFNPFVRREDLI